jgi:hypothetical protein
MLLPARNHDILASCLDDDSAWEAGLCNLDMIVKALLLTFYTVTHTDTFQGLCLRYKVCPTALRRANRFSGSNLLMAPTVLVIPVESFKERPRDEAPYVISPETQIRAVLHGTRGLSGIEAKAYLELNDWDVDTAIANAREDLKFEQDPKNHRQWDWRRPAMKERREPVTIANKSCFPWW